ncbi:hypothetical protein GYA27_01415 [candidate division WWE3 bacterium]|uniref:Uncharacterized protein n=1 Tax=candidate division WWE3 bacterium TaxID=2053526 RepID=A0A7X9HGZ2_UNCKA|nr:hypothetical protein [candidate division WWE3 bacterium]
MDTIAISRDDAEKYGCPYCGYQSGFNHVSGRGASVITCGECKQCFIVLSPGVNVSPFGIESGKGQKVYPKLSEHPRKGTPKHGAPDKRPEKGGEFFHSRGIGLDNCICFVCGTRDRTGRGHFCLNNIAAFVTCKAAGERVVAMFGRGARLDYREREPDRVQVKIGACDKHLSNLKKLEKLTENGVITEDMVRQAGG